ncbi:MAG: sigma factor, partial [Acidobacteriota bacterium]
MRLKTAAATAPALQPQTLPLQTRLRAVSGKGAAPGNVPSKPMATSISLHSRTAPKGDAGTLRLSAIQPKAVKARAVGPTPAQANTAQENARLARRDRVVLEHLPLVKAIAIRVHENLPVHVDVDDLVHSGVLGLFDAASKYNPDKQVAFSSYA